jgi:DNA-directed RNA polymerase specialized sigma24 family protein
MTSSVSWATQSPEESPPGRDPDTGPAAGLHQWRLRPDADRAVTALYGQHYQSLVRLAAFLVPDVATAEQVVQDAFVALPGAWRFRAGRQRALDYLRWSVVNRSRLARRRHRVPGPGPAAPGWWPRAGQRAADQPGCSTLIRALRALPARQREALVLRYYAHLSEAETASAMGVSTGAVRRHLTQAGTSLRLVAGQS